MTLPVAATSHSERKDTKLVDLTEQSRRMEGGLRLTMWLNGSWNAWNTCCPEYCAIDGKRAVTPPRNISARSAADAGTNAPPGNIRRMPADISGAAAEQRIPGGVEPAATALTSVQIPFIPAVDNMNKWAILPS